MDVLGAGARQRCLGHAALRAPVDQAEAARRVADRDVVGDREVGDQRQLLEDADDAGRVAPPPATAKATGWPSSSMRPASGCDDAGHDLDQRRLAGAVLAEHGMDAAGLDREVGALERAHAAVALGDALHRRTGSSADLAPRPLRAAARGVRPERDAGTATCSLRSGP